MKKSYALVGAAILAGTILGATNVGAEDISNDMRVVATNDLGMHCVCMGFDTFVLLPPFNTLRAQVIARSSSPKVITDSQQIRVEYNIVEDTHAALDNDPYFQSWVTNSPKLFPGFNPIDANGEYVGLTGAKLHGEMESNHEHGYWEIAGIPAYPVIDPNGVMVDPLGGPNRNPFLTANVKVYNRSNNQLLAETNTVAPAAFGGCCSCHIDVAASLGYPATPLGSFQAMGMLHEADNGINIANIDPDGDGVGGPIRCSQCHLDPAMGESTPPGYAGYPVSQYTFSDVLHRWHVESPAVLAIDPDLATDCYMCHPGNGVNCYRGHHTNKTINGHSVWCSDCHGDLNQRVAEGQMLQPWSDRTLPTCSQCHGGNYGEGGGYINSGIFGKYLNSKAHDGETILCSTCHGEPHALYPSNLGADNAQMISLQGTPGALGSGSCNACHTNRPYGGVPPHH